VPSNAIARRFGRQRAERRPGDIVVRRSARGAARHALVLPDAIRQHSGCRERAAGGTLILDAVGELPPSMQARLLRALQERSFFSLGSEKFTHR
jgi:transcriptional regulator of aromatic amino acid metabolism